MTERKKPGPRTEKPLKHEVKIRVDDETLAKLEFCVEKTGMTRSQVLRKGVDTLYEQLQNK